MNEPFEVHLTRDAVKDVRSYCGLERRIEAALLTLEAEPERKHLLHGSLRGVRSLEFSLPGGAYRVAYYVERERRHCIVFAVGAHEGFYERVERRWWALRGRREP